MSASGCRLEGRASFQRRDFETKSLGSQRFLLDALLAEIGDRLEAIVAGAAIPQKRGAAALKRFNPVRSGNRFTALSAGILLGHRGSGNFRHGALPFFLLGFSCLADLDLLRMGQ